MKILKEFFMKTIDLPNPENLKKEYEALVLRPCHSVADLRALNVDWDYLNMKTLDAFKRARIAYTCNTQDEATKKNEERASSEILPIFIRFDFEIGKKITEHPKFEEIKNDFPVYYRNMKSGLSIFREENVALFVEEEKLISQYDAMIGALTADYKGETIPFQALARYSESGDREVRKAAFLSREKSFTAISEKLDELFLKMLKLRHQIALNAGFKNYRDYKFHELKRFDYSEKDCFEFHNAIEKLIVPLMNDLNREKEKTLGLDRTRPWDLKANTDLNSKAPFETPKELLEGCRAIFKKMDPELHRYFEDMVSKNTLDLEIREGKAGGGYCSDLPMENTSFIFMNTTGSREDVGTLTHEAGHSFHNYFAAANVPIYGGRHSGSEFAEVASMSMELLARPYLDQFYPKESLPAILKDQLIRKIKIFPFIAMIDAFQHWVYTAGEGDGYVANPLFWREKWVELEKRFIPYTNWSGHERFREMGWQYNHVFTVPFYFVDYGIAQMGAFAVWANSLKDEKNAISLYKKALKLGGTKPLPELFETIGAKFGLGIETLKPVLDAVKAHLRG